MSGGRVVVGGEAQQAGPLSGARRCQLHWHSNQPVQTQQPNKGAPQASCNMEARGPPPPQAASRQQGGQRTSYAICTARSTPQQKP